MVNAYVHDDVPCATMMNYELNTSPNTYPKFAQNPFNLHLTSTQIHV
jgi:hypothetical protein